MSRWPFRRSIAPGQVRSDELQNIREELELYLELRTEELVREGLDPEEARRRAEQRFGDTEKIEGELRRQARRRRTKKGTVMTMGGLRQDLTYALRIFRRSPGFTAVAVMTLALAIGGNTAIFSVFDAALLQAMPFEDAEELVYLNGYHLANGEIAIRGASFPEFNDWAERARGVAPMAAVFTMSLAVSGDGEAESLAIEVVSEAYFRVFRVAAALGRTFTMDEHADPGGPGVAVISHDLWERRFGGDPDVLSRTLMLNDQTFTVVGVMPEGFGGTALDSDVWMPDANTGVLGFGGVLQARGSRFLSVVGRRTTDADQAQSELDVIARDLQEEWPSAHEDRFAQVQEFREAYLEQNLEGMGRLLWVLLGAGGLLLLIAAANVSNLLLVRSYGRTRELVLRRALGAETHRVAGQLLTEGFVLAALGGVGGLLLAALGLSVLSRTIPVGVLPGYVSVDLSGSAFVFTGTVLALVGLFMGLVPAGASARVDIATTLREGGRAAAGSLRRFRAQHAFVVTQVALALVLMVGAGLLTRSFRAQLGVDTGADLEKVVALTLSLPGARYPDQGAVRQFATELERLAGELPGVNSVSVSTDLPLRGEGSSGAYVFESSAPEERIRYHRHSVSPGYLETLGLELNAGRFISPDDRSDGAGVGVITEAMVRRVFPDENPIGQTMYLAPGADPNRAFEVVGVIEDLRYRDLTTSLMAEGNSPDIFFAFDQLPSSNIALAVKVDAEPSSYVPLLRELVGELDSNLPVFNPQPLIESYRAQTATPRFAAFLMGVFSTLAVILACVGIYGVLAFTVGQRSQEIAIRRAIGASAPSVAGRVVGDGLKLTALGLLVGGVGASFGARTLSGVLYEVPATDPVTFVGVGAMMIGVAVMAALIPALRATRKDPAEVLVAE